MRAQVVVIGSGPAGLSAAQAAAAAGAKVLVIEEAPWAGGHLACRVDTLDSPPMFAGRRADQVARDLLGAAELSGATVQVRTLAWGLFPGTPIIVAVCRDGLVEPIEAESVVVATGSLPVPYPFTGWTLPGVTTASAVERLINRYGFIPGRRAVVVGDTQEARRVAWLLDLCGVAVQQVRGIDRASGRERVEHVTVGGRIIPADLIILAVGRMPQVELLNAAGCPVGSHGTPDYDPHTGRTPISGVFVAGSAAGTGSLEMSIWSGIVAGTSAAEHVGVLTKQEAEIRRRDLLRQKPPTTYLVTPNWALSGDAHELICRCEEVPRVKVEAAIMSGARTVDDVKRMTRCGMGFCQGKNCTHSVMKLLKEFGSSVLLPTEPGSVWTVLGQEDAASVPRPRPMRLRPPVRPIRLGNLAAAGRDVSVLEWAIHPEGEEPRQ